MIITYIGHACFRIEENGYSVVIDPYKTGMIPGLDAVCEEAQMVIASHGHDDHNATCNVRIIEKADCPFEITSIETYHDECKGSKRGKSKITIIDDGKQRVAHFGDIGCDAKEELSRKELELITNLDAALIPVGGKYTIDAKEAADLVREINPKRVIPMHFRADDESYGLDDIAKLECFTSLLEDYIVTESSVFDTESESVAVVNVLEPLNASK